MLNKIEKERKKFSLKTLNTRQGTFIIMSKIK